VAHDPNARVIGHILAVTTNDALASIPGEFKPYLSIMSKEAADALPRHRPTTAGLSSKKEAPHHGDLYNPCPKWNYKPSKNG